MIDCIIGWVTIELTDGGDDEHDEEGVEHGHDGRRERREDVLERRDAPEEPNHAAKGAAIESLARTRVQKGAVCAHAPPEEAARVDIAAVASDCGGRFG